MTALVKLDMWFFFKTIIKDHIVLMLDHIAAFTFLQIFLMLCDSILFQFVKH